MPKLTGEERETIINWNESDDIAYIYTASRNVASHLTKGGLKPVKKEQGSWWFEVPKQAIRVKPDKKMLYVGGRPTSKGK